MGLFGNYESAGVGIPKNEQEKQPFFKFWEIFFRHFWKIVALNFMYLVACIPLVTIGPATAGLTKVLRNISQERPVFLAHDMWTSAKKCFKQAFPMGLIDLLFILGFIVSVPAYNEMSQRNNMFYIPFFICLSCMVVFIMMHFYIYLMISSTTLSFKQIIKNSFYLTCIGLKTNLITLLVCISVFFLTVLFFPVSLIFVAFIELGFLGFVICFNSFPIIRKYVINPYYEAHDEASPEFSHLEGGENVFTDKGGEEAPIEPPKKKSKGGKTIS